VPSANLWSQYDRHVVGKDSTIVEISGEDMPCYSNRSEAIGLCVRSLSDITETNIPKSFTYNMAAKTS